jgi:phosphate starvation-inducible PhoH-like protein
MGLGKANSIDTQVFTPFGKKKMGDIMVGDFVIGSNGLPTLVEGVYPQGIKDLYRVTFNDGYSTLCCKEHLWTVTSNNGSENNNSRTIRYTTLSVEQMLDKELELEQKGIGWNEKKPYKFKTYYKQSNGQNKWQIPIVKPIEFTTIYSNHLPINPYLLGIILGDGHITKNGSIRIGLHMDDFTEIFKNQTLNETKGSLNIRVNCINTIKNETCFSFYLIKKKAPRINFRSFSIKYLKF